MLTISAGVLVALERKVWLRLSLLLDEGLEICQCSF